MFFISLASISLILTTSLSAGVVDWSSSVQVHEGRYLFATVQDNGHSCLYGKQYKSVVVKCEGCDDSDDPKVPDSFRGKVPLKDVLDSSGTAISIIASSIAIGDVMATLQERYDNDSKHRNLFELAEGTLAGKYAIYRGTWHYYKLMELIGEKKLLPAIFPIKCLIACSHDFCRPCTRGIWGPEHGKKEDRGTSYLEVISKVAKETHSSESVSCPSQP